MVSNINLSQKLGGYEIVGQPANRLPQNLASAIGIVNEKQTDGSIYNPIFYVGKQLVKGMNYLLLAEKIYAQTKGVIKNIVGLVINIPPGAGSIQGKGAFVVEEIEAAEIPADIKKMYDALEKELSNITYKPIIYLGNRVIRGITYSFICEARPHLLGAQPYPVILTMNVINGSGTITGILPLTSIDTSAKDLLGYAFSWLKPKP